jgi:tryptophanase
MSKNDDLQLQMETLAEPYRIKMVERIRVPSRQEREKILREAFYSVAYLNAKDVFIDLATDSGTGAMSDEQWGGMMRGDEAYIRSKSFFALEEAVEEVMGYSYVVPTHQGRGAEHILMGVLVKEGDIVLCNTHFDTTAAHVKNRKAMPVDLVGDVLWDFGKKDENFKGNFDLEKLKIALERYHKRVPFVLITILNNLACSSPVSMDNIRKVREIAEGYGVPVYFDASRFAENAWFIKAREPDYKDVPIHKIIKEMFSHGDGCWMSAKKDAIVNIGGFIAFNKAKMDSRIERRGLKQDQIPRLCQERLVLYEGFMTYGGMAGRDLEAMAIGLREGIDEAYLQHRTGQVAYLAEVFKEKAKVKVSEPAGGSGVFVDVAALYEHLTPEQLPGIAMACDLYLEGGVRAGAIPFHLNTVDKDGNIVPKDFLLARFALPRRVYTKSHLDYVGEVMKRVKELAPQNKGYRSYDAPEVLPHFFAKFEPLK